MTCVADTLGAQLGKTLFQFFQYEVIKGNEDRAVSRASFVHDFAKPFYELVDGLKLLDLDHEANPDLGCMLECLGKCWHGFASKTLIEFYSGIKFADFRESCLCNKTDAIRGSIKKIIVHYNDLAIGGKHNVDLGGGATVVAGGMSIGVSANAAIGAAINAPVERNLLVAEVGKGAWRNGERLPSRRKRIGKRIESSIAYTGVSTWMSTDHDRWLTGFVRDQLRLADRRTGSAATSLCAVILGEADLYIGFGEHIWDVAGGAIIAEELGCAHSIDWSLDLPDGHFTFICGEPNLVEKTMRHLETHSV
jgi:Inositol monophosphatase family